MAASPDTTSARTATGPFRVAVVHPEALVRDALLSAFVGPDFELVFSSGDVDSLGSWSEPLDVLLTAIFPAPFGEAATRFLRAHPETAMLAFEPPIGDGVDGVLTSGARGVIPANVAAADVVSAAAAAANGWFVLRDGPHREALNQVADARARVALLKGEESELLQGLARGDTIAEIADALFVSERTVKRRIAALRGKLGCNTREELAVLYGRANLSPSDRGRTDGTRPQL